MGESDEENFVTYGEALEPLDEENLPKKKPVTIEDQYATDAQGRRRFHGAFTGGFSAGYFNSVGTRDGWRPQQFKSSRSSKAGSVSQRPEDFMDEEDTGEFGIAPTGIRATSDFVDHSEKGKKRERARADNDGPIPGVPVLRELLKPVKDTIGVTLLRQMGWKPGQGVGPRLTKTEKKITRRRYIQKKVYGCTMPGQDLKQPESLSESSDDDNDGVLFAPDDYEPFRCNPKDNYFGIGYSGLDRRPVLSSHINLFDTPSFQVQDKNKKLSIRGQAFGVGAFEADDEDIYAKDDMSHYDFTLGPESKPKSKNRWSNSKEPAQSNCLEGFVAAKKTSLQYKKYPPPELPKDYKPIHHERKSRFSPVDTEDNNAESSRKKGLGRHELNSESRAVILGETNLQIDKNTSEATSKISPASNIIARTLNLHGRDQVEERARLEGQKSKSSTSSSSWLDKLNTTSFVLGGVEGSSGNSSTTLQNFHDFKSSYDELSNSQKSQTSKLTNTDVHFVKPFIADVEKQKRFEKFLQLVKDNKSEQLESLQPLSMTEWEREYEREEFKKAAILYERTNTSDDNSDKCSGNVDTTVQENPAMSAAKMKMFGKLTRIIDTWAPASIVCKRFNIPEPLSGCAVMASKKNKKYSVFESLDFCGGDTKFQKATDTAGTYKEPHIPYKTTNRKSNNFNNESNVETSMSALDTSDIKVDTSEKLRTFEASYEKVFGKSTSSVEKQKISDTEVAEDTVINETVLNSNDKTDAKNDLYKAIFLSSSEDSDTENEADEVVDSDTVKLLLIGKPANELNVQRNNSPPRGIFAKLDLDDLLVSGKSNISCSSSSSTTTNINKSKDSNVVETKVKLDDLNKVTLENANKNLNIINSAEDKIEIVSDMYGPALPNKMDIKNVNNSDTIAGIKGERKPIFKSVVAKLNNSEVALKWIEKTKGKKLKKEKRKHKHKSKEKEKKHKHKSKKKKH